METTYNFDLLKSFANPFRVSYNGKRLPYSCLGGARPKFELGNLIIKMDKGADNPQSTAEARMWKLIELGDKKFFAPILHAFDSVSDSFPGFIVQEKLDIIKPKPVDIHDALQIVNALCIKYSINDVVYNEDNWAVLRSTGEPVILDYGLSALCDEISGISSYENSHSESYGES